MVLDLFNVDPFSYFFETPHESKPPCEIKPLYESVEGCKKKGLDPRIHRGVLLGIEIYYALAGFKEEDLKVWSKKRELFIEGSNNKETSFAKGTKFACSFKQKFTVSDKLDLTKMTVDFEDGLLMVYLPVKEETESDKVFHFGGSKEKE